ncbi:oxidoreductase [Microbacterium sp. GCS4]|uniref:oxidoreductase n=1 Tax=Microbacterium sp. GCS4 TaxID=1692239 RepID=UPI0006820FA0|nr:oxidoreductase [Microbacterium sp. GCS4]KNY05232.1 2-dehydropantoate 2-reductase [Microbacterium sp. GCS4]
MSDSSTDTSSADPRIAVVGPGAIGTTITAALHAAGRTPALYGRTAREELELLVGDERIVVPGPVHTNPDEVSATADVVFLAVKATQIDAAAPWLDALCGPGTVVCVLQNGVEQVALVSPHVGDAVAVLPSVVWFPAQAQADGTVRLRGDARLTIPAGEDAERIAAVLDGTLCRVEQASDFAAMAWRKLLQNAAAGLMALTGRRAGAFHRDDLGDLTRAYLRECAAVALAEGVALDDGVADEILAGFRSSPADLSTSILTDREAERPLEWDVRNGVVSRLGRRHGIPTPVSDIVTTLLAATSDGPG